MNILPFRVALAQINVTVGDLEGNARKILAAMRQAHAAGAHVMCVPELALAGYPPEDLLLKPGFVADNLRKLHELVEASRTLPGLVSVIGFVDRDIDIYNAAAVIAEGELWPCAGFSARPECQCPGPRHLSDARMVQSQRRPAGSARRILRSAHHCRILGDLLYGPLFAARG